MTEYVLYTVYWEDMNDSTYLYGSSVQYLNKRYVSFESLMMPAGVPIKEWDSFTDFQAARHEPRLPLLVPGESYVFRVFCRDEPRGTVFFRAVFYDRQNRRISSRILKERQESFVCPPHTFRYVIQMVNGGAEKVLFGYFELCAEKHTAMHTADRRDENETTLHVFVPAHSGRVLRVTQAELPSHLRNVTVLSPLFFASLRSEQKRLMRRLEMPSYDCVCFHLENPAHEKYIERLEQIEKKLKQVTTEHWNRKDDE